MKTPYFVRLAQIDDQHFFTACRHGLVHLTWARATLRLTREEFKHLVDLLARATDSTSATSVRNGALRVTYRPDDECEFRMDSVILLLSPSEFEQFAETAQQALQHLSQLLASGAWDREETDDEPQDLSDRLRRNPFSRN